MTHMTISDAFRVLFSLAAILLFSWNVRAQRAPYLVKDWTSGDRGSSPYGYTEFQGDLYFHAYGDDDKSGLWKLDGITGEISHVANAGFSRLATLDDENLLLLDGFLSSGDLYQFVIYSWNKQEFTFIKSIGAQFNEPSTSINLPKVHGTTEKGVVFSVKSPNGNRFLWITDGTNEGTIRLNAFYKEDKRPYPLVQVEKDHLVFATDEGLWFSDGSKQGTILIDDDTGWNLEQNVMDNKRSAYMDDQYYLLYYSLESGYQAVRYDLGTFKKTIIEGISQNEPLNEDNLSVFRLNDLIHYQLGARVWAVNQGILQDVFDFDTPYATFWRIVGQEAIFLLSNNEQEVFRLARYAEGEVTTEKNQDSQDFLFDSPINASSTTLVLKESEGNDLFILDKEDSNLQRINSSIDLTDTHFFRSIRDIGINEDFIILGALTLQYGWEPYVINKRTNEGQLVNLNSYQESTHPNYIGSMNSNAYVSAYDGSTWHIESIDADGRLSPIELRDNFRGGVVYTDMLVWKSYGVGDLDTLHFSQLVDLDDSQWVLTNGLAQNFIVDEDDTQFFFTTYKRQALQYKNLELWHSNGTTSGTKKVASLDGSMTVDHYERRSTMIWKDKLYFFLDSDSNYDYELWVADNAEGGIKQLSQTTPTNVQELLLINDRLFLITSKPFSESGIYEILDNDELQLIGLFDDPRTGVFEWRDEIMIYGDGKVFSYDFNGLNNIYTTPEGHRRAGDFLSKGDHLFFITQSNHEFNLWYWNSNEESPSVYEVFQEYPNSPYIVDDFYICQLDHDGFYFTDLSSTESRKYLSKEISVSAPFRVGNTVYFPGYELYAFDLPYPSLMVAVQDLGQVFDKSQEHLGEVGKEETQSIRITLLNSGDKALSLTDVRIESNSNNAIVKSDALLTYSLDVDESVEINMELSGLELGLGKLDISMMTNIPYRSEWKSQLTYEVIERVVSGIDNSVDIKVYPNPVDKHLQLDMGNRQLSSLKILDLSGRLWYESLNHRPSTSIDVSGFPQGIYALRLETSSNKITTRKIIIQH